MSGSPRSGPTRRAEQDRRTPRSAPSGGGRNRSSRRVGEGGPGGGHVRPAFGGAAPAAGEQGGQRRDAPRDEPLPHAERRRELEQLARYVREGPGQQIDRRRRVDL